MKVFVSSSWRNLLQPEVVAGIKAKGHEVYDFRDPRPGEDGVRGFSWAEIDPNWQAWSAVKYRDSLELARVQQGFDTDMNALRAADAVVMVQPCGRSAALELGWAAGAGKPTIVLLDEGEPELMLKMADHFCLTLDEVVEVLEKLQA